MKTLPPTFPRGLILFLNMLVLGVLVLLGMFLKSIDVRYVVGAIFGYLVCMLGARLVYGFWLFEDRAP